MFSLAMLLLHRKLCHHHDNIITFDIQMCVCDAVLRCGAERRRNCGLTPLATSQQHNQGPLSPARLRRLRLLLDANLGRHSSEEELERISRIGDGRKWASALHQRHGDRHSSASSDEEVRDLCGAAGSGGGGGGGSGGGAAGVIGCVSPVNPANPSRPLVVLEQPGARLAASPSPVLFSSSPPHSLKPPPLRFQLQVVQPVARPIILTHFDQSAAPYRKNRHSYSGEPGRPSLDLEKMQQVSMVDCGVHHGPGLTELSAVFYYRH